jgi:hypothetical protein
MPGDPEGLRTPVEEATGVLGTSRVVVLPAAADLLGVVLPRERHHSITVAALASPDAPSVQRYQAVLGYDRERQAPDRRFLANG